MVTKDSRHKESVARLRQLVALLESRFSEAEIGRMWGISQQRVHQLKVRALRLRDKKP